MVSKNLAKGYCAEALVEAFLHQALITPWKPCGNYESYDLAVLMEGVAVRIQIKAVSPDRKVYMRSGADKTNKRKASKEFDVLAAVDVEKKLVYFIPKERLKEYKYGFIIDKFKYWCENINGLIEAAKQVRHKLMHPTVYKFHTHSVHDTKLGIPRWLCRGEFVVNVQKE